MQLFLLALLPLFANGLVVDDDQMKITYYSNSFSSCTFNRRLSNVVCVNKYSEDIVEYNKVKGVEFCDYSFCILPIDPTETTVCSGLSFKHSEDIFISFTDSINLLDTGLDLFSIDTWFDGLNIIVHEFIQNAHVNGTNFKCNAYFGMCYNNTHGKENCHGLISMKIFTPMSSLILGVSVLSTISGVMYFIMRTFKIDNTLINLVVIPFLCISITFSLAMGSKLVIQILPFLLGSFVGVGMGYVVIEAFKEFVIYYKKRMLKAEVDDGANVKMLKTPSISNFQIKSDSSEEDQENETTIELGRIKSI